jgi:hypothetical protein
MEKKIIKNWKMGWLSNLKKYLGNPNGKGLLNKGESKVEVV